MEGQGALGERTEAVGKTPVNLLSPLVEKDLATAGEHGF